MITVRMFWVNWDVVAMPAFMTDTVFYVRGTASPRSRSALSFSESWLFMSLSRATAWRRPDCGILPLEDC